MAKNIWQVTREEKIRFSEFLGNPSLQKDYFAISTIAKDKELSDFVLQHNVFTNISAKSVEEDGSTARACCLYKYLVENSKLDAYLETPDAFIELVMCLM